MPEVSDADLTKLKGIFALHEALYTDGETGMELRRLIKKKFPKASIPEIDVLEAAKPQLEELVNVRKELDGLKKKLSDDAADGTFNKALRNARKEFHLTDEGIEKVKEIMVKNQIADPRAAAALFTHDKPLPPASGLQPSGWNLFNGSTKDEQESMKQLLDDPDAWLEQQIPLISAEHRNAVRA